MSWTEYGIICDRRGRGLGRMLLATGPDDVSLWARADKDCRIEWEHSHLLVARLVSDWSEPIAGEMA